MIEVNFEDTFNSDFVNLANQNYKNEFFNHSDFQPYNYNGQYIQFSGENSSTYKFKYVSHSSYNIEFMLMSEVTTPNHVMSDISPGFREKATVSKGLTIFPRSKKPRSPPLEALGP